MTNPSILLQSGNYFDFLHPERSVFTIQDIAHALSNLCRFTGHCRRFYSVAQHSVHVSRLVSSEFALAGLMHDAAEAFLGDVSMPLKSLLPDYREIESRVEQEIFRRFGLPLVVPEPVKAADMRMLAAERMAFMPNDDTEWDCLRGVDPGLGMLMYVMTPEEARTRFLSEFERLTEES